MSDYTALVMAGGRLTGKDAKAARTTIKALTILQGATLLERVLAQIQLVSEVSRTVVIGPKDVLPFLCTGIDYCPETSTLLGNVQAGVTFARLSGQDRVLLVGSDLAFPKAKSFSDFIRRSPKSSLVTVPLVRRASYASVFPNSRSKFVPLRDGEFTIGSQFTAPAELLLNPPPGVQAILGNRKSQVQMAATFGPGFVIGLLMRTLTIAKLERRASEIMGVTAIAVPDCAPDLAFDLDDRYDIEYARLFANNLASKRL